MTTNNSNTCVLDYNHTFDGKFDSQIGEFANLLGIARTFVNPWFIWRLEPTPTMIIAMSYDGNTSKEQAERNGRV